MCNRINELVKQALEETNGNWADASKLMESWVNDDPELLKELMKPLISKAVWDAVRGYARSTRTPYFREGTNAEMSFVAKHNDIKGIEEVSNRSWYNYVLHGGLKLGEAKYQDLKDAYELHQRLAETNAFKARWIAAIAKKIENTNYKVCEVVSEEEIGKLAEEVK